MASYRGHICVRRKAKDGTDGAAGKPGLSIRTTVWQTGKEYRNDTTLDTTDIRYLDICADKSINIGASGVNFYVCKKTHTSSSSIPLTNTTYWTPMNSLGPLVTPLILASAIKADYLDVADLAANTAFLNALYVKHLTAADGTFKGEVKIYVGNQQVLNLGDATYPLWIGAALAANAPFKVNAAGKIFSNGAEFQQPIIQNTLFSYTIDDSQTYMTGCSYDFIDLNASLYRVFNISVIGATYMDITALFDSAGKAECTDFTFRFSGLVVGVEYTILFHAEHKQGQEAYHQTTDYGFDGESGHPVAMIGLVIKDVDANVTYKSVEIGEQYSWQQDLYPRMVARVEGWNGQICCVKFIKTSSGIRITSFSSEFLHASKNYE